MRAWRICILVALLALLGALAVGASGATRKPGLDRSYGHKGVVHLTPPLHGGYYPRLWVRGFAAAPDGAAYVYGEEVECGNKDCDQEVLTRYGQGGSRDRSFGAKGTVVLPPKSEPAVMADGSGRPLVGVALGHTITVRRLNLDGMPDRSFGQAGVTSFHCACGNPGLRLFKAPRGRILVDATVALTRHGREGAASKVVLTRLLPNGAVDRSFGRGGSVGFVLAHPWPVKAVAVTPTGAVVLGGAGCCGPRRIYLERVTADGQVDSRFDRTAASSVRRLSSLGEFPSLAAVVARPDGTLDALGSTGETRGYDLRLSATGRLVTGYARRGLRHLPIDPEAAVAGTGGAIFAVGYGRHGVGYHAFRILRDGRLDPAYGGPRGIAVPIYGSPLRLAALAGGRVLATDQGRLYCREGCGPEPAMARLIE